VDEQESNKEGNIHLTRFLRVLANFLILCCLCGSGYLIYFVVKRSQEFSKMQNVSWYERNEVRRMSPVMLRLRGHPEITLCWAPFVCVCVCVCVCVRERERERERERDYY
jgi:hypothetical protein